MKKEQHEKLKKSFEDISKLLEDQNITINVEERKNLETLKTQLAGALMSSWLPVGGGRKFIMFLVAFVAVYLLVQSAYIASIITIVILCMFSPRIVGEVAILVGILKGNE